MFGNIIVGLLGAIVSALIVSFVVKATCKWKYITGCLIKPFLRAFHT